MTRAFFFAHYTAWGLIWGHVLVYYALFAHRSWRSVGGQWRAIPAEAAYLLRFTFAPLLRDCHDVLMRRQLAPPDLDYHYTKAHRMSFFIAMGAISYTLMGALFANQPDRTLWPLSAQLLSVTLVGATSIAGLGHLFTALESSPRRWRWFVAAIVAWYPVSMGVYSAL